MAAKPGFFEQMRSCTTYPDDPCLPLLHVAVPMGPLRVVGIILGAIAIRLLVHHVIHDVVRRATAGFPNPLKPLPRRIRKRLRAVLPDANTARREQRFAAVGSVLGSVATTVIAIVALVAVLDELGINISGVVTVSSVVGVALGFGAQTLVRDYLNGLAMLVEDQYGVGDTIDAGPATGTVEGFGLRVTRLRDSDGVIWHIRNGEITRVANKSQGWGRAIVDVLVSYEADLTRVRAVLQEAANTAVSADELAAKVLDAPVVMGVERFEEKGAVVRVVVRTNPADQDDVARQMRAVLLRALAEAGVPSPYVGPAPA